jgi:integrase
MTIRIEQGKGAKDRYTLLSPRLLSELRRYWLAYRPPLWLFPRARCAEEPMAPKSVQRIFYAAKDRAASARIAAFPDTWGQNLDQHVHVHALASGGALAADGHWIAARNLSTTNCSVSAAPRPQSLVFAGSPL